MLVVKNGCIVKGLQVDGGRRRKVNITAATLKTLREYRKLRREVIMLQLPKTLSKLERKV